MSVVLHDCDGFVVSVVSPTRDGLNKAKVKTAVILTVDSLTLSKLWKLKASYVMSRGLSCKAARLNRPLNLRAFCQDILSLFDLRGLRPLI